MLDKIIQCFRNVIELSLTLKSNLETMYYSLKKTGLFFFTTLFYSGVLFAQCPFTANLSPNNLILCPQETASLNLVVDSVNYDSIKWFKWLGISGFQPEEIVEWQNLIQVNLNQFEHSGYYFFARVSEGDFCSENSDTVLVDGYIFLPPVVQHNGNAELNQNGIWEVACGQEASLELMLPYTNSITWYRNGTPIEGENEQELTITQSGLYTVSGAPALCPNSINFLGLELEYLVLPNPELSISAIGNVLTASSGNTWQWYLNGIAIDGATQQNFGAVSAGFYQVEAGYDGNCSVISDSLDFSPTGIENTNLSSFIFGPNPCSTHVYFKNTYQKAVFQLIALDGRTVKSGILSQNQLDLSDLPSGIYVLNLQQNTSDFRSFRIDKVQ
jgi:hypothetical protein